MQTVLRAIFIFLSALVLFPGGIYTSYAEDSSKLSGKVVETMDSGGYTYVQIDNGGKKTWVAVPRTKVVKGQDISFYPGSEMYNFESKTLNRTFDTIIFSGGVVKQAGMDGGVKSPGSKGSAVTHKENIKVEKASGPDAYTVEELFSNGGKLENKTIFVKGKVVKVSAGVMDRNWIHIQDGSGNPKTGTSDLIVTSNDLPAVGDVVTASGVLHNNKDFGSGYKYLVIIENASIKK